MSLPTLSELIADLQLAKELAIQSGNANSLVTATMAQAKLLGLDKGDTLTIKHTEPPVFNIQPVRTLTELDKQEFEQIAKKVLAMV